MLREATAASLVPEPRVARIRHTPIRQTFSTDTSSDPAEYCVTGSPFLHNGDATAPTYGRELLDRLLAGTPTGESPLTHVAEIPARPAHHSDWPQWAHEDVVRAFREQGVERPWHHQATAADIAAGGEHVVVSTGTASGKSVAYQLPVLSALADDPQATALYLSPTKALGADQLRAVTELTSDIDALSSVCACAYDGDTSTEIRQWTRRHSRWIFTNPDMLHLSLLPSHARWARLWRRLRYVVVDECHAYRGVFGSHVALILRRLRRIARRYGSDPVFILASATTAEPGAAATRLIGAPCHEVTDDGSPHGPRTVAMWEPPLLKDLVGEHGAPVRRSAGAEAARLLADLVVEGARTLAFVRSRHGAELTAMETRQLLAASAPDLVDRKIGRASW